ncbi:optineurin isoform X2 [Vanessa atalanta]|uniref:optineurin isoform X2 n=1 Tax=Vanessa atalanta TaxID=42275 RepID=UPI001FCD7E21|nr:optineurin isoform X2 [Vanessa atalanta]XP_047535877.1 optineurin isoform X2 [Vanessa atalanta]
MSSKPENDDDSFIIILGTSPGASMDVENCNGIMNGDPEPVMHKSQIEDAMKDLSVEANMAFKAQFNLADSPSPASMMVASTIITDDRSTEELQKRFGELLDENVVLKETLKQNNDSMKEQFMLIASCQEDMLKTHKLHREKFDETRDLVERLRQENKQLKHDLSRLTEAEVNVNNETGESKSGVSSEIEFVTSPDDDTIDKLTVQLELVEKQRRQVIVENEKLSWQKESLEHIVDATTKERDDAKEKLKNVELQLSNKENDHMQELQKLNFIINDLQSKLKSSSSNVSPEELRNREAYTQQLEGKYSMLQSELKKAQIKIIDLENVKLEFTQHKSGTLETVKMYKEQIQELNNRIKEIQKTVFQPVRFSISSENESLPEYANYMSSVKLYDRTLKHLSEYLDTLTNGLSDSLVHTLGVIASLQDFKLERASVDRVMGGLAEVKQMIEKQHSAALSNLGQVRGALSIFEGIFKDFNELLKKSVTKSENTPAQLSAALLARAREVSALRAELADCELLRAQLDSYRSDFEAEREAREKMASEKEIILTDLRTAQRKIQELTTQLEKIRALNPALHKSVTTNRPTTASARPATTTAATSATSASTTTTTGNMVYTCPKCMKFSSDQYKVMEDHFDFCLDDF